MEAYARLYTKAHTLAEMEPQKFSNTVAVLEDISYTVAEALGDVWAEPVVESLV